MADGTNIDTLEIEITATSEEAAKKINTLTESVRKLQEQTKQKFGNIFKQIGAIGENASPAEKKLHEKMDLLKRVGTVDVTKNVKGVSSLVSNISKMEKELDRARKLREQLGDEMLKIQDELDQQLQFEPKFRNTNLIKDLESQLSDLGKSADVQEAKVRTLETTLGSLHDKFYIGKDLSGVVAESNAAVEEAKAKAKELAAQMREVAKDAGFLGKERLGLTNDLSKAEIQAVKTDGKLADMRRKLEDMTRVEGVGAEGKAAIQAAQENVERFASAAAEVKDIIEDIRAASDVLNNTDLSLLSPQEIRESAAELKNLKQEYRETSDAAKLAGEVAKNAMAEAKTALKGVKGRGPEKELGFLAQVNELAKVRDEIVKLTAPVRKLVASLKDVGRSALGAAKDLAKLGLSGIGSALGRIADGAKSVGKHIADRVTRPFKTAAAAVEKWKVAIGRIAFYRVVREAIRTISDGFKEGTKNLYEYSRIVGTEFAPAMNSLATSSLYLKNSLGAMAAPLIQALAPAIDFIIDKFVALLNVIGKVFAALTGKSVYTQAKKHAVEYGEAAKDASKATKDFLLGIDELNVLNDKDSGAGGAASDFGDMFEEVEVPNDIKDWAAQIRDAIENGEWRKVGEIVAEKLNEVVDSWDSYAWGAKLGKLINNGLNVAYGFLTTFDFENLGRKVADAINGIFDAVDWDLLGRTFAAGWNGLFDFIYGFITGFHWDVFGKAVADAIVGFFSEIHWERIIEILQAGIEGVRQALVGFLSELGERLDIHGITDPLVEIVNTVADTVQKVIDLTVEWAKSLDFIPILGAFENLLSAIAPLVETLSNGLLWAYQNVLLPLATWTIETAIPEAINFFAEAFTKLNEVLNKIDFTPIIEAFQRLGESISPLIETISDGLMWGFENVLLPLASWTIEEALPAAVDALTAAFDLFHAALERLSPVIKDFVENVAPVAGEVIINALNGVRDVFEKLTSLIKGGTTFAEFFDSLTFGEKKVLAIVAAVTGAIAAFKIASGAISALVAIGKTAELAMKGFEVVTLGVKTAMSGFGLVAGGLKTALAALTSPIGLVVAAVAALAAGFTLLYQHSEGFRNFIDGVIEGAKNLIPGIIQGIQEGWAAFTAKLDEIKEAISTTWENVKTATSEAWESIKSTVGGIWDSIKETAGTVFNTIKETVGSVWEGIKTVTSTVWNAIKEFVGGIWNGLKELASTVFNGVKDVIGKVWETVKTTTTTVWDTIKTTLSNVWEGIKTNVVTVFNSVKETVIGVFEKIKEGIKTPINAVLGFIEKMVNGVIRGVNTLLGWMNKLDIDVPEGVPFVGGMHLGFDFDLLQDVDIPRLAKGGFLDKGQLFIAREAGPELVGKIGAKNAVANNMQIIEGIKQGVYQGVLAANQAKSIVAELEIPTNILRDIEPVQPQCAVRQNPYATIPPQFAQAQAAGNSISNYSSTTTTTNVNFSEDRIISAMGAYFERLIDAVNANGNVSIDGKTLLRSVDKARRERGADIMGGAY